MKLENGKIKNSQLLFMVTAFMQSMALTVGFCFSFTKQNTWIVVLASYAITILAALMYLAIQKKYPGQNIVQINDKVFGKYGGKLISIFYVWFFFELTVHYLYFFNSFWITFIMPETPRYAFLVIIGITCVYAVRKGLEVIARTSFVFTLIVWLTTVIIYVLVLGDMKVSNLLPVLGGAFIKYVQSTHVMVAISCCDIVTFVMILPYTEDQKKLKKPFLLGISISAFQLFIIVIRNLLVLGPRAANLVSSSFAVAQVINLADVLTRMDILVAISHLVAVFIKLTIFFYAAVLGSAQLFNLRSYKPLVIPLGALAVIMGAVLYPSDMEQVYAAQYAWPFNTLICEFILPAVTLLIIGIKSLAGKKEEIEKG